MKIPDRLICDRAPSQDWRAVRPVVWAIGWRYAPPRSRIACRLLSCD